MAIQANGTHAKEIALKFLELIDQRATPAIMGKTINQAKSILNSGYTKEEVLDVLDYVINVKNVRVYSLGYVSSAMNDGLRELKEIKARVAEKEKKKQIEENLAKHVANVNEVKHDDESTRRNQEKARRLGVQSRFREKFDFDMFEGQ